MLRRREETPMPEFTEPMHRLHENLTKVIHGKTEALETLVITIAAGGSVLMEDVPGVGKTTLAKALAKSLGATFQRVQFTPDLLPADILGASIYDPSSGAFNFRQGPIFCNVLLADEINRASPRTQSALLEAMSEQQVTIEGQSQKLPAPFVVVATQNPVDFHGTYPLPEAQLDRFMARINLGYPNRDATRTMLFAQALSHPVDVLEPVVNAEMWADAQRAVREVRVDEALADYITDVAERSRGDERVKLAVGPRGILMLFRAAQAAALYAGRDYVLADDIQRMAVAVLPHRLMLQSKAKYSGESKEALVAEWLQHVPVPT